MPEGDERWMREALRAAREAALGGEVPVGACVVSADGALLSAAGNRTRADWTVFWAAGCSLALGRRSVFICLSASALKGLPGRREEAASPDCPR